MGVNKFLNRHFILTIMSNSTIFEGVFGKPTGPLQCQILSEIDIDLLG